MSSAAASTAGETPSGAPNKSNTPNLTVPQWLAFTAFLVVIVFAIISSDSPDAAVQPDELVEVRKFAVFLIAALLPSDGLIRFGRNLLFQNDEVNGEQAAATVLPTTLPQVLAFLVFVIVALLTLVSNKVVAAEEFAQVNEVARVLVAALLPSEAVIRFGRALYYRAPTTPTPNEVALRRV